MARDYVIHVVEDDGPMRHSLVALLEGTGYKVRAYTTAEELLASGATEFGLRHQRRPDAGNGRSYAAAASSIGRARTAPGTDLGTR